MPGRKSTPRPSPHKPITEVEAASPAGAPAVPDYEPNFDPHNGSAFLADFCEALRAMPEAVPVLDSGDTDLCREYITLVAERLAAEHPSPLSLVAAKYIRALASTALRIVVQRANARTSETATVNGRKVKLSAASASVLRACNGKSEVLADDRKIAALLKQLPELASDFVKDASRSRMGHSYYYLVSDRLSRAIAFAR